LTPSHPLNPKDADHKTQGLADDKDEVYCQRADACREAVDACDAEELCESVKNEGEVDVWDRKGEQERVIGVFVGGMCD
jgi:hypothetical protein